MCSFGMIYEDISIDSSSLKTFALLLSHLSQITERTNNLLKIYDNLGF